MAETKKTAAKKTTKKVAEPVVEETKVEAPVEEAPKAKKAPAKKAAPKAEKAEAPKKAKEEKKAEAPKKPMPTEARAIAKNVRVTPRKVRLVIDLVRGLPVKQALGILDNLNRAASEPVMKLIKSAAANATNNFGMDEDALYIAQIYANDGLRMKRYLPRAKGSASGLVKRSSHITVVVKMR
jgi:ribosomal protein L22, bacterial type